MVEQTKDKSAKEHPIIKHIKDSHIPLLAVIPEVRELSEGELVIDVDDEAKKQIDKLSILIRHFSGGSSHLKSIMISSVQSKEGNTNLSISIAKSLAKLGKKILLVDCDVRKPIIHRYFNMENEKGLVDIITYNESIENTVKKSDVNNLFILTGGSNSLYPEGLFTSSGIGRIIKDLETWADMVIYDMVHFSDNITAEKLAKKVDKVILNFDPNKTNFYEVSELYAKLSKHSTRFTKEIDFLGVIVNRLSEDTETRSTIMLRPPNLGKPKISPNFIKTIAAIFLVLIGIFAGIYYLPTFIKLHPPKQQETKKDTILLSEDTIPNVQENTPPIQEAKQVELTEKKEAAQIEEQQAEEQEPQKPQPKKEQEQKAKSERPKIYVEQNTKPYKYSLHISSSQELDRVIEELKRLETLGHLSFATMVDLGELGKWYRIFVGAFHTEKEAKAEAEKLKKYTDDYAAVVNVGYTLAIGTYKYKEEAEKSKEKIGQQFSPYVLPILNKDNQTKYNVCAGAFYNRDEAIYMQKQLAQKGISAKIVLR